MSSKQVFLRNEALAKWWVSIVRDPRFAEVGMYALATIAEQSQPDLAARGATLMLNILEQLPDNPDASSQFPSPGIHHHFTETKDKDTTRE